MGRYRLVKREINQRFPDLRFTTRNVQPIVQKTIQNKPTQNKPTQNKPIQNMKLNYDILHLMSGYDLIVYFKLRSINKFMHIFKNDVLYTLIVNILKADENISLIHNISKSSIRNALSYDQYNHVLYKYIRNQDASVEITYQKRTFLFLFLNFDLSFSILIFYTGLLDR